MCSLQTEASFLRATLFVYLGSFHNFLKLETVDIKNAFKQCRKYYLRMSEKILVKRIHRPPEHPKIP
jgi:hypothetical protein